MLLNIYHNYNGDYSNQSNITRKIIFENTKNYKQTSIDIGSSIGPYELKTKDNLAKGIDLLLDIIFNPLVANEAFKEEYVKQEDEVVLSKKKVTKKDVAPDLTAIKLMMDYFDLSDKKIDEMTTEELLKEKEKLKEILENYNKVEDDGNM